MVRTVCIAALALACVCADSHLGDTHYKEEAVYTWNVIEYEWPSVEAREQAISDGNYEPKNSAINGIKVYKDKVYVTTPRLKTGVPSTLNVIVENQNPDLTSVDYVLRPFPSWDMQTLGDCRALQLVQSMEIDVNTGYMWIVDTGFVPKEFGVEVRPFDHCASKMVIYDLDNDREISRYDFPRDVVGPGLYYLNDIVLGYENEAARYAFMSETLGYKLVVYDLAENRSYSYSHPSMDAVKEYINITIGNNTVKGIITGINGIAMSPDFKYIYYSAMAGVGLHQVETSVVTSANGENEKFDDSVRTLGEKVNPGDGMAYGGRHNLYYSALGSFAVYRWDVKEDVKGGVDFKHVQLHSQSELVSHSQMDWVDTLALDDNGYLWFTTSRLHRLFSSDGIDHQEPNFFVWRVFVDDYSYMNKTFRFDYQTLGSAVHLGSVYSIFLSCMVALVSTWLVLA